MVESTDGVLVESLSLRVEGLRGLELQFTQPTSVAGAGGDCHSIQSIEKCQEIGRASCEGGDQAPGVIESALSRQ